MKVLTLVGTRPEIIKMSRVIPLFDEHTDHTLVHTGQNYDFELNRIFFEELGIRNPDIFLEAAVPGRPMETVGQILTRTDDVLAEVKPDAFLVYGDTNSGLAVLAAKRRKVPVFHMEAGNRSFDERVPEEINRRIIDHTSDINFTLTQRAREYLLREGLPGNRVIVTGSHMEEVLDHHAQGIETSDVLKRFGLAPKSYIIVSLHREENVDVAERAEALPGIIQALTLTTGKRVIVSTHPRTRARLEAVGELDADVFLPPFGFLDYVALQKHAFCVVSDSGTISEESNLLGFPAVTVRDAHERPEIMESGGLIMVPMLADAITSAVDVVTATHSLPATHVADYRGGKVSRKILFTVLSYTRYVDREVWRRSETWQHA